MPSLADYLQSQDSLNANAGAMMPAVTPQIAPDLAQRSAQAIMATTPQMTRQAQSAAMGGLTPSSMRSMMAPRGGLQQANLDFSPVSSWSEGLSGGLGNAMAMIQANRANQAQQAQQQQLMDFYRQQQEAVLQQEQAKQQAEQAKIVQVAGALKQRMGISDNEALAIASSDAAKSLFGAYEPLMQQGIAPTVANMQGQQLQAINPALAGGNQAVPITPIQQQQANVITGAPAAAFNQYTPQQNYFETQAKSLDVGKKAQELGQAQALQPLEIKAKAVGIQGSQLDNVRKQFENSVAPINQQIKELEAQGKIDEAAQKRADLEMGRQLLDATLGNLDNLTSAQRAGVTARLKGMGVNVDIPDVAKPQVVGSGKEARIVAPSGQLVTMDEYNRIIQQPAVTVPQQQPQRTDPVTVKAPVKPANKTTKTGKGIVVTSPTGQSITFGNNPKNW